MGKSTKVSIRTRRQGVQGTLMLPHFPYPFTMGREEKKGKKGKKHYCTSLIQTTQKLLRIAAV